ncbi:MAG: minor capsid protein [Bacteroidales bacterium]|nr:minor capsid protein [Bacteroidales bacterium]
MNTLNVANIVNDWIEKKLNLPFTIYNDVIPDTSNNAACLRYDPAPAAEKRYIDGTRLLKWNLTYYVRNKDRTKARKYADEITATLDGVEITDETSGVNIQIEAQTLPQYISVDDKNNTLYSAAIVCTYLEPRENMEA